jgi:hypothetical protein
MKILANQNDLNIVINGEQVLRTDLGWQDNLAQFEDEVLKDIINPADNYETVRYIHKPYTGSLGLEQTDIWYQFFFLSGSTTTGSTPTYVQEYEAVGISTTENEFMLRQSTESFFRLEFYKTPGVISGNTLTGYSLNCEPPTNQNKRLVFSKNLSLPLGEKFFYEGDTFGYYIHLPVFMGSNYKNKENMYLFWFEDETVLEESDLIGLPTLDKYSFTNTGTTTLQFLFTDENQNTNYVILPASSGTTLYGVTGQIFEIDNLSVTYHKRPDGSPIIHGMNTFFLSPRFFNAKDGSILDFTNTLYGTGHTIVQQDDLYFQVDFDHYERTYQIYRYSGGTKGNRIGHGFNNSLKFYEKGGGIEIDGDCAFSGGGVTYYVAPTRTPTATPSPTNTPTPTPTTVTVGCKEWTFTNNGTGSTLSARYIPCGQSNEFYVYISPSSSETKCVSNINDPYTFDGPTVTITTNNTVCTS